MVMNRHESTRRTLFLKKKFKKLPAEFKAFARNRGELLASPRWRPNPNIAQERKTGIVYVLQTSNAVRNFYYS